MRRIMIGIMAIAGGKGNIVRRQGLIKAPGKELFFGAYVVALLSLN